MGGTSAPFQMWEQPRRDTSRARLTYTLSCQGSRDSAFPGHPYSYNSFSRAPHLGHHQYFAGASHRWFSLRTASWSWLYWWLSQPTTGHHPVPLAPLCCFTVLLQIWFSAMACLSLLSRRFLVPIAHQSHPCPAAQQAFLCFLPSCHPRLDDALEQHPAQVLASLKFLLKSLHSNRRKPHSRLIPLPFTLPTTVSLPPFRAPLDVPAVSFPVLRL